MPSRDEIDAKQNHDRLPLTVDRLMLNSPPVMSKLRLKERTHFLGYLLLRVFSSTSTGTSDFFLLF
jgi:hypothetical protein